MSYGFPLSFIAVKMQREELLPTFKKLQKQWGMQRSSNFNCAESWWNESRWARL